MLQVLQAQNLGYNGAIVQNHFKDEGLVSMGGDTRKYLCLLRHL